MEQGRYIRDNRRKKRGRKIFATVAFLLTVLAVATVICLALFFNITQITVAGLLEYTPEEVIAASGIRVGQNIFAIDDKAVQQAIHEAFPYVDTVSLVRLLPTTLELVVTETKARLVLLDSADSYTLLGENGRVLRHKVGVSTEGLPLFVGVSLADFPEGQTISQSALEQAAKAARKDSALQPFCDRLQKANNALITANYLLEAVEESGLSGISYYDIGSSLSVAALYDNRVMLELGSELELPYKMKFAREVLEELGESFTGTVNLTTAGNNNRSYTMEQDIRPLLNSLYREGYY